MVKQFTSVIIRFLLGVLVLMSTMIAYGNSRASIDETFILDSQAVPSAEDYKNQALEYAANDQARLASKSIISYMSLTGDLSILNDHLFEPIKDSESFMALKNTFIGSLSPMVMLCLYAGFLGFFIFLVINTRRGTDHIGSLLIGLFVLFHCLFLIHRCIYVSGYQYAFPNTLYVSTTFSFLYGPLLYFYFKRIIQKHQLQWSDLLHLIPSAILLFYLLPYYGMSSLEKFNVLLDQKNNLLPGTNTIIVVKIISLSVYAFFTYRLYKSGLENSSKKHKASELWQRNIIAIFIVYVIAYIFYGASITTAFSFPAMAHLQTFVMAALVFYVAYIAYAQPEIFKGKVTLVDPVILYKYKKSGLTPSLSVELRDKLVSLMNEEKVYRQSDINLEKLAELMETTRHNASQVVNEHFGLNFFELMNKYRIAEAMAILQDDSNKLSIIQVAYQVGFNNKVTFNKSFKKMVAKTPSQYVTSLKTI